MGQAGPQARTLGLRRQQTPVLAAVIFQRLPRCASPLRHASRATSLARSAGEVARRAGGGCLQRGTWRRVWGKVVVAIWGKLKTLLSQSQPLARKIWRKQRHRIGGGKCCRIIGRMTVAKSHNAYEQGETPTWAWPVHAFVAWLATILGYITRFKSARRFKPDWRDSWEDLRQSEWLRDQLIAQGVAQLLAGKPLHLDDKQIILEPPAAYGGPCPRSPFDMNRRFLTIARWAADPQAIIRERFKRLTSGGCPHRHARKYARATSPSLRLEEESNRARRCLSSSGDSRGRWIATSWERDGGGSRRLAFAAQPRAPPTIPCCLLPTAQYLGAHARLRSHPHAPPQIRPLSRPSTTACRGRGGPARSRTTG